MLAAAGGRNPVTLEGVYHAAAEKDFGITMAQRLATFRFFCSHNSFEVFDSDSKPWEDRWDELHGLSSEEKTAKLLRGWYRRSSSIVYRTVAQGNDHRIDIYWESKLTVNEDADRVLFHNISLPSGKLRIFGLDCGETITLKPGEYVIQCRAFNLDIELPYDQSISDDEFLRRDDLERYELILSPGTSEREGLILGFPSLDRIERQK
jgi:hypothetical protein